MTYLLQLAYKSVKYRKASLFLSILSISLSVVLLLGVERIRSKLHESFTSTITGTDLIVGARTGNIPILLSTIFHMGYPNQNLSWETFQQITSLEQVAWSIPISLGDSHKGYPVVATSNTFFEGYKYGKHQNLSSKIGKSNLDGKNCVMGFRVANQLGYRVGDKVVITHGMGDSEFIKHNDEPFIVVGILNTTGTPVDKSIFVSIHAMESIHANFYSHDTHSHDVFEDILDHTTHNHCNDHDEPSSLSSFLLGLKNKGDILSFQRTLNDYESEPITAIMPALTLLELWEIIRPIEKALIIISLLVLIVSLAGIFTTIISALNERRREMAILRSVGAKPQHIFGLVFIETSGIILCGIITGIGLFYLILFISKSMIADKIGVMISIEWLSINEITLVLAILIFGSIIGIVPSYQSYKNSITDGLIVNK